MALLRSRLNVNFFLAKKALTERAALAINGSPFDGAVAQLGERLNGIQEVVSSILISSTIKNNRHLVNSQVPFCLSGLR